MTFLTSPDYDAPAGVVASMIRALTRSCKAKIAHSENADGHAGDWGFELAGTTAFALGHSLHCNITPANRHGSEEPGRFACVIWHKSELPRGTDDVRLS